MRMKFIKLLPLLAVAGFVVAPAVSQAEIPHWYKNGFKATSREPEGTKVQVVTWGNKPNLAQESSAGKINCESAGAGYIENPKGTAPNTGEKGPAGVGQTQADAFFNCESKECKEAVAASPLGGFGFIGVAFAAAENLPWNNQLEGTAEPFEEKIGAPSNGAASKTPAWGSEAAEGPPNATANGTAVKSPSGTGAAWGAAGSIGAVVGCEVFPNPESITGPNSRVVAETPFEGELHPQLANNGENAKLPATAVFIGVPSGTLNAPGGILGNEKGEVKYLGYAAQDSITVHGN